MIYAVNKRTKEHRIVTDQALTSLYRIAEDWRTVNADPDGWIPWEGRPGAKSPIPYFCRCDIRHRDGEEYEDCLAELEDWHDCGGARTDIVAYRPGIVANAEPSIDVTRIATEPPAWDGEGPPPVGCECEWSDSGRPHKRVLVMGHYGESIWVRLVESDTPLTAHYTADSFRPIRSEEDRFVDEVDEVMKAEGLFGLNRHARALFRAGLRFPEKEAAS